MFLWSTQNQRRSNFKFRRWFNIDKLNLFWCWNTIIISTLYKEFDFTFRTVEFIWEGRLFQIFGLKTLKLLSPYFTWFGLVTLRFKVFCFDFLILIIWKCQSLDYLLSCIFLNTDNAISLFSLRFSLLCLKLGSGCFRYHCTTVAKLSLIYFPFYSLIYMHKNARLMENS